MNEEWRVIKDYEGYQVSNYGRVRSVDRYVSNVHKTKSLLKGRLMKQHAIAKGYLQVALTKNGTSKWYKVHRLVAQAFIPNPNNYPCVNHKDCNTQNNVVSNLEWCDWSYNNSYGDRIKKINKSRTSNKKYGAEKIVYQYDVNYILLNEWKSAREASRNTSINISGICLCCNGKQKTAGGYIWKYKKGDA